MNAGMSPNTLLPHEVQRENFSNLRIYRYNIVKHNLFNVFYY